MAPEGVSVHFTKLPLPPDIIDNLKHIEGSKHMAKGTLGSGKDNAAIFADTLFVTLAGTGEVSTRFLGFKDVIHQLAAPSPITDGSAVLHI